PLVVSASYLFIILAVANLNKGYKASQIYEERNRYLYVAIGIFALLFGALFDIVSIFGIPISPGGGSIGNIVFCIFTAVAIMKYHLLDIYIVIRKGAAYLLISAVVALPYVSIILVFNYFFGIGNIPFWAHSILLLLLALILQTLWRGGQNFVDRWFYRERYDFLRELENFSQETHDITNLKQLGSSLVKLLSRALQAISIHLLLTSESEDFTIASSTTENIAQFTLKSHSPLLRWLRLNNELLHQKDLDIIPQLQSLTVKERDEIDGIMAELFVPVKVQKDELVGLLIIGRKLSQQTYSKEDKRIILTVASRVAVQLENARLYALEKDLRQELQRQNEEKTVFLHNVAHEIKTPLTSIIAASELLDTAPPSVNHNQRQRLVHNINQGAWVINKRVDELLNLAKLQIGNLGLNLESLEVLMTVKEITRQFSPLFENKEQSLRIKIPNSLPPVEADKDKLEQVLSNLLSNANKFSPSGSIITLLAREAGDRIVVEVKDSAPVITEKDKDKVFDPYYRGGDIDAKQRIPGLGLGLAISKKIVELHQGKIWIESESGKGNTFIFSLPIRNKGQRALGDYFPSPSK
ncbi:ATP-binding protein, partial [Chloroflexota bacterium]